MRLAGDWAPECCKVEKFSLPGCFVLNFEGPFLSDGIAKHVPASKAGPSLYNNNIPAQNGRCILVLANNHTMDYGEAGLNECLVRIDDCPNFSYVGAGKSKAEAQAPLIFDWNGIRVGIIARCEIQFGIASDTRAGVAGFDASIYSQIKDLKRETDLVIVSIHAAAEMMPWPSPRRQIAWRSLIDVGADVVHGHHSHVPQGWEHYRSGLIFYGLGNLCVDPVKWKWHPHGLWSFAPELSLRSGGLELVPKTTVIDDLGGKIRVREATIEETVSHQRYLFNCNRPLSDSKLLEGLWQEGSVRMYQEYYSAWLNFDSSLRKNFFNIIFKILQKVDRVAPLKKLSVFQHKLKSRYLLLYHMFACESHNDAISTALGLLGGELDDCRSKETSCLADEMIFLSDKD